MHCHGTRRRWKRQTSHKLRTKPLKILYRKREQIIAASTQMKHFLLLVSYALIQFRKGDLCKQKLCFLWLNFQGWIKVYDSVSKYIRIRVLPGMISARLLWNILKWGFSVIWKWNTHIIGELETWFFTPSLRHGYVISNIYSGNHLLLFRIVIFLMSAFTMSPAPPCSVKEARIPARASALLTKPQ